MQTCETVLLEVFFVKVLLLLKNKKLLLFLMQTYTDIWLNYVSTSKIQNYLLLSILIHNIKKK